MPKKRQLTITGTERDSITEIDEVAQPYVSALYQRMELQKEEANLLAQLEERMAAHKQKLYVFYDEDDNRFEIRLDRKVKIHVKRIRQDSDQGGEEE